VYVQSTNSKRELDKIMNEAGKAWFLELVCIVNKGLPTLDPALLTATVDRCESLYSP
jgi:hypothetical protein